MRPIIITIGMITMIMPIVSASLGWEMINSTDILHFWNNNDDYYLNTTSGIQLTNHYQQYWTKNVFCGGYNYGGWQYYCTDTINWQGATLYNSSEEINVTGWINVSKIVSGRLYSLRFALRYHLKENDENLTILLNVKNIGYWNVPIDLGFAWRTTNINIGYNNNTDNLYVNDTMHSLNSTFNINYTNLTDSIYYLLDNTTSESLWLQWNPNLTYILNTNNQSETLAINVGTLNIGQEKTTSLNWLDDVCSWSTGMTSPTTNLNITTLSTFNQTCYVSYSGTCLTRGTCYAEYHDGSAWKAETTTTNLSTPTNPQNIIGSTPKNFVVTANHPYTYYQVQCNCTFNSESPKLSASKNVTVYTPEYSSCSSFTTLTSDLNLTGNSAGCYNVTASGVSIDCKGYTIQGTNQKYDHAITIWNSNDFELKNCIINGFPNAIYLYNSNNSNISNVTITNGTISDTLRAHYRIIKTFQSNTHYFYDLRINNITANNTLTENSTLDLNNGVLFFNNSRNIIVQGLNATNISTDYTYSSEGGYYRDSKTNLVYNNDTNHTSFSNINIYNMSFIQDSKTYENLTLTNANLNLSGIQLAYCKNANINHVLLNQKDTYGIGFLSGSSNATINNITISATTGYIGIGIILATGTFNITNYVMYGDLKTEKALYVQETDGGYYSNIHIENTTIYNADSGTITFDDNSHNNIINNLTIINVNDVQGRSGAIYNYGLNNTYTNVSINNVDSDAIINVLGNMTLTNASLTQINKSNYYSFGGTASTFINVNFNKTNTTFQTDGYNYRLRVLYDVIANVTTNTGTPLIANVTVVNYSENANITNQTQTDGTFTFQIQEYYQIGEANYTEGCTGSTSNIICLTPHTMSAEYNSTTNSTSETINQKKTIPFTFYMGGAPDPCTCPVSGDLTITSLTICTLKSMMCTSNLIITNSGWLVLNQSNLTMSNYSISGNLSISPNSRFESY